MKHNKRLQFGLYSRLDSQLLRSEYDRFASAMDVNVSVFDTGPLLTNFTAHVDRDHQAERRPVWYLVATTLIVGAVLGFVGNLSTVVGVAASRQMRNATSYLLIAILASVDLAFVVVCLPLAAFTHVRDSWPLGDVSCKVRYVRCLRGRSQEFYLERWFNWGGTRCTYSLVFGV